MKIKFLCILLIGILAFTGCKRDRTNQFDVCNEDFTTPPPLWYGWVPYGYYYQGYLVGVQIEFVFAEGFARTLGIKHIFYQNGSECLNQDFPIESGTESYTISINYGGPMPLGEYCLKLLFGEISVGAAKFSVVDTSGKLVIQGTSNYLPIEDWFGDIQVSIR